MNLLLSLLALFGDWIGVMWYLLGPIPSTGEAKALAAISRNACECDDCMEPGLRGPSRTSLD